MSSKTNTILWVAAGFAILVLLYLLDKTKKEVKKLEIEIDQNKQLTAGVRNRLLAILKINDDIDPQVAHELTQIAALLEIDQETKAVLSLAKIIERLLKRPYQDDADLLAKKKKPAFSDHLDHAHERGVISNEDYHLLSLLRLIRNEEAHELNVKKEPSRIAAVFVAGIGFVLTLHRLLRRKTVDPTTK